MNNENFAGIMGTVKQAEITNGVCGYDTENRYAVLRVCVPRKSGAAINRGCHWAITRHSGSVIFICSH